MTAAISVSKTTPARIATSTAERGALTLILS
jgi:hypothetical protein